MSYVWTDRKPEKPGWYWWRSFEKHMEASARIVQIIEFPGEPSQYWTVEGPAIRWSLGNTPGQWFSEPIEPPLE